MKINEDFARYIISLMEIAKLERGEEEIDRQYRNDLELFFVQLREEREQKEYTEWIYKTKIEADPRVIELRKKMENPSEAYEKLSFSKQFAFREALFKDLDDLRERLADLYISDKAIKDEWRILASINKMLGIKGKVEE
jgi:hypothetical protein